jgi:hypothetical protein
MNLNLLLIGADIVIAILADTARRLWVVQSDRN